MSGIILEEHLKTIILWYGSNTKTEHFYKRMQELQNLKKTCIGEENLDTRCVFEISSVDYFTTQFVICTTQRKLVILLLLLRSSCSCLSDSETRGHNVVHCQGKFFCCAIEFLLQRSVVWPRSGS